MTGDSDILGIEDISKFMFTSATTAVIKSYYFQFELVNLIGGIITASKSKFPNLETKIDSAMQSNAKAYFQKISFSPLVIEAGIMATLEFVLQSVMSLQNDDTESESKREVLINWYNQRRSLVKQVHHRSQPDSKLWTPSMEHFVNMNDWMT